MRHSRPANTVRRAGTRLARYARRARLRRSIRVLAGSGLLSPPWYLAQAPARSGDAAGDWVLRGRLEGRSPNPLFEAQWCNPDGWRGDEDPLLLLARGQWPARGVHPLLAADVALAPFLASVVQTDLLPMPAGSLAPPTTWGLWTEVLSAAQHVLDAEVARRSPRVSLQWDRVADATFVRRWSETERAPKPEPLVSIVMPVRNRPGLVLQAISSVQAQSYPMWELLVVDDGSDDTTPDVVEAASTQDPRVRLLRRQAQGVCSARNAGIAAAAGGYVAFLDSDNEWSPHFLQVMVAVMRANGLRAAFAVVEEQSEAGTRFRTFDGDVQDLRTGNFVDLNVLVVDAALLAQTGGFDESLRRMVDYDLVWRVAEHERPVLVPFVGVRYRGHAAGTDRISVREPLSWDDVVKSRRLLDWDALREGVLRRDPGLVSVIVPVRQDWQAANATVRAVLDAGAGAAHRIEVIVVDNASTPGTWRLLWALVGLDPRVRMLRSPVDLHRAAAVSVALPSSGGATIVVVPAAAMPSTKGLATLVDLVRSGTVEAVRGASCGRCSCCPDADVVAVDAAGLIRLGGLDPLFVNEFEVDDLMRRISGDDPGSPVPLSLHDPAKARAYERPTPAQHSDNVREWRRRWPDADLPPERSGE
ncbi:MAG TPA: glycosyltransferase [Candidatus Nanopelagicales bacterium]